ncbi:NolW domain-containing protein [Sulfuricella denitrificans skB26]|uniref:NolW domain-containing protein n=1 Tax=Sulfuricella denitrificans (strain DSM 22764 / NBRC 105220 / skB26) TaxID=1163617 RepID=S6AHZ5_SULDS|nr:hypothetical protein [Sulfuricella denitrificans]BAN35786.1 NolW domain-containing protein [Sulfuricella denitrificans skB26]
MLKKLIVTLLLSMLAMAAQADYPLKIIPLKHHSAEELIPVIRPMLGDGENIGGMNYQLFVRASDKGMRDIELLLAELDRARKNLKITLQQDVTRSGGATSQGVSGEGRVGDMRVIASSRGESGSRGGLVIGGAEEDSLRYRITRSTGSSRDNNSQFINVLEGAPAFIRVGQSLPYVQRFLVFAGNRVAYGQDTQFLNVTTGFDVLPRLNGDRVELEIAPRLSFVGNGGIQDVRFQELRTTVSAKLGEWVELGGMTSGRDEVSRAILETASTQSGERRTVRLKVEEGR